MKIIPNYENYSIDENGIVINNTTGKQLATQPNSRGYLTINLWKNNKLKKMLVHRLVAELYLDNFNNLPFVNHKDKNKINNNVNNLEWCTAQQNSLHSLSEMVTGRSSVSFKIPVVYFDGTAWVIYESINEASRQTGISTNTIKTTLKKVYKNPKHQFEYATKSEIA